MVQSTGSQKVEHDLVTEKQQFIRSKSLDSTTLKESESEVVQSCSTLCDPVDCSLPRSSIHGIFQARVLEWVAISFSRGSSQPRGHTWVSHIVGRRFTIWATKQVVTHTLKGKGWNLAMTTRRQGTLGAISEAAYQSGQGGTPYLCI